MNTGMQDSFNLAWKLALVVRGTCGEQLPDTYSRERSKIDRSGRLASLRHSCSADARDFGPSRDVSRDFGGPGQAAPDPRGLWLVGPDGYVAIVAAAGDGKAISDYLRRISH
jgi:2-polyprenyl-6-methoxyphenol hydroxylase-like FAD-dependent oxidoreductase